MPMEHPNGLKLLPISVVILPLPAQGHLNQLLHLSRRIASTCAMIDVHYVGASGHNRQARERVHGWDPAAVPNLRFHDFDVPRFATPLPDPNSAVKFPSQLQPAFESTVHLASPLSSLLGSLSSASRRVVLIHDSAMSFASGLVASVPNAESYVFHSVSALALLLFFLDGRGEAPDRTLSAFVPKLSLEGCFTDEFVAFVRRQHEMAVQGKGRLLNTCRAVEAEFVDRLGLEPSWQGQKVFSIGPINPVALQESKGKESRRHECLRWLDRHPPASVIYVSFGTTSSLSRHQIVELASGLKSSGHPFVWVLRGADRGDIYADEYPGDANDVSDLEDVTATDSDRGLIVRGWAPQLEVLGHRATGGFVSHCGWNSCMESMSMGVPMLTWPMHSDQPWNAVLVTEVLGSGIAVREWAKRDEVLPARAVSESIRRLMGCDGKETIERARAVKEALGRAMDDGGSSREDFHSFVDYIVRS